MRRYPNRCLSLVIHLPREAGRLPRQSTLVVTQGKTVVSRGKQIDARGGQSCLAMHPWLSREANRSSREATVSSREAVFLVSRDTTWCAQQLRITAGA